MYDGIEIELIGDRNVTIFQKDHMLDYTKAFGEDALTYVSSPAENVLLDVNKDEKSLSKDRSVTFYRIV